MLVPRKGKWWRFVESLWVLLLFTVVLNWAAFLYIGIRTRNRRWLICSAVYSIPFIMIILHPLLAGTWLYEDDVRGMIYIAVLIVSAMHGLAIRKDYLIHLEMLQLDYEVRLRRKLAAEYGIRPEIPPFASQPAGAASLTTENAAGLFNPQRDDKQASDNLSNRKQSKAGKRNRKQRKKQRKLVDVNKATEKELAELPGMGIILAKKACQYRRNNRGFRSVDEFFQVLNMKPHAVNRLRPLITAGTLPPLPPTRSGRVVDY